MTNITDHCAILNTSRWEDSFGSDRYITVTKRVLSEEEMNSLTECIAEYNWEGVGHFGHGHLGRGHYGRDHFGCGYFGRGHLGRGHFGPLI